MDKCRLCLKYSKKLKSIFDKSDGIRFAEIITAISNVKVSSNDGITDQICFACRRKAKESYDFKLQVERSHEALQENCGLKKIHFSNLGDIKFSLEITECDLKPPIPKGITENMLKKSAEPFNYNDTVIQKVSLDEKKPLSVIDFLNSIKQETENDFEDDYSYEVEVDYDPEIKKDPDFKLVQPPKKKRRRTKPNLTILRKPVVPVFLSDYVLAPAKPKPRVKKAKELSHVCPYCGKMTKKLQQHLFVHAGEKPFKCDECSTTFVNIYRLKQHVRTTHSGKKFKCDICTATFKSKATLQSHLAVHSNEKKFVCNICHKAFKWRSHLPRHISIMHSGAKPWKCEECPDTFNTKYGLKHHMRVHTKERPFKCEICSQPYSYKHDFNRHCLKKHGVFFYRRTVHVMNEEVLLQERILMRDLMLRLNGVLKDDKPVNPFDGPQAPKIFDQLIKAIESGKVVVDLQL